MEHFSTAKGTANNGNWWAWLAAGGLALATAGGVGAFSRVSAAHPGEASTFERRCIGSYLVLEETTGAQTIWTFHADRTLVSTSSGELFFAFGNQQGSWRPQGPAGAKAVQLNFDWNEEGVLDAIGRVEIEVEAGDARCDTLTGSFEGRLFLPGENPLELGDTAALFGDTVTGERIVVP